MRGLLMRIFWPWAVIRDYEAGNGEWIVVRKRWHEESIEAREERNRLRLDKDAAIDRADRAEAEVARLTRELDGARTSCDKLDEKFQRAVCQRDHLNEDKVRLAGQITELNRQIKVLDDINTSLRARIGNAVDQLEGPRSFRETVDMTPAWVKESAPVPLAALGTRFTDLM